MVRSIGQENFLVAVCCIDLIRMKCERRRLDIRFNQDKNDFKKDEFLLSKRKGCILETDLRSWRICMDF